LLHIDVSDDAINIGGVRNYSGLNSKVIFDGTGSFSFNNTTAGSPFGEINAGTGTLAFNLDVSATSPMSLVVGGGGTVSFEQRATFSDAVTIDATGTQGGELLTQGGAVVFNEMVTVDGNLDLTVDGGSTTFLQGVTFNNNANLFVGGAFAGSGMMTFGGASDFAGLVTITNQGGTINSDGGSLSFSGQVNSNFDTAGAMFTGTNGGTINFDGGFSGTGDQSFTMDSSAALIFNDQASFDGGSIVFAGSGGAAEGYDMLFNDDVTLQGEAAFNAIDGANVIFNGDFNYNGDVSLNGNGTAGQYIFSDNGTALVLGSRDDGQVLTIDNTRVDFLGTVNAFGGGIGSAITLENGSHVSFARDVTSSEANFRVNGGSALVFERTFTSSGDSKLSQDNVSSVAPIPGFLSIEDLVVSDGILILRVLDTSIGSLSIADGAWISFGGHHSPLYELIQNATIHGDAMFGGEHLLKVNRSDVTFEGTSSFAADGHLRLEGAVSSAAFNGDMDFAGDMTFVHQVGVDVSLGQSDTSLFLGGNLTLDVSAQTGSSFDVLGSAVLKDGVEDFTLTIIDQFPHLFDSSVNFHNTALANISEGLLDVQSGTANFMGAATTNSAGTLDLTIGNNGLVQVQALSDLEEIQFGALNSTGAGASILSLVNPDDPTLTSRISVRGGAFDGLIADGDDNRLTFTNRAETLIFTGTGNYTGSTRVFDGGTIQLGNGNERGEILATTRAIVGDGTDNQDAIRIANGVFATNIGADDTQDGLLFVGSNGLFEVRNEDGNPASEVSIAGDLAIDSGGTFDMVSGSQVSIAGDTQIFGSLLASGFAGTVDPNFDLTLGDGLDDSVIVGSSGSLGLSGDSRTMVSGNMELTSGLGYEGGIVTSEQAHFETGLELSLTSQNALANFGGASVAMLGTDATATSALRIEGGELMVRDQALVTADKAVNVSGGTLAISGTDAGATFLSNDALTFSGSGVLNMSGESTLEALQGFTVSSEGSFVDGNDALITGGPITIADGGELDFIAEGTQLDDLALVNLAGADVTVEAGGSLVGNVNFRNIGNLQADGFVRAGAKDEAVGRMNITDGNYVSGANGELQLGFSWDAAAIIGEDSFVTVENGNIDFSAGGSIMLGIEGTDYISTESRFTILEVDQADDFIDIPIPQAARVSVTRRWEHDTSDPTNYVVSRSANYMGYENPDDPQSTEACLTGDLAPIGAYLDTLIPDANGDPLGREGSLLGSLDAIDNCPQYERAVAGLGPIAQSSMVILPTRTEFYDVLRHEIRRETIGSRVSPSASGGIDGMNASALLMQS
ncbi:MAG: hypothetical protein MK085_11725, partial [Phycisphaerales bacterium]|nr:hypothetical protein [Phycisphaerales bacterium]